MTQQIERKTSTFVIRIWLEYLTLEPPALRGEIVHVGKEEKNYFASFKELEDLLLDLSQERRE